MEMSEKNPWDPTSKQQPKLSWQYGENRFIFGSPPLPQDGKSGRDLGFSTHLKQTKDETTAAMSLVETTRLGDLQRGIWRGRNPEGLRSRHGDMALS